MSAMRYLRSSVLAIALVVPGAVNAAEDAFPKWSKIELAFSGPESQGRGDPNPFAVRFTVQFTGPQGMSYDVPGFYDGDGRGGMDGNVWKVRFSADQTGGWKYKTQSSHRRLDGHSGEFVVTATPDSATGFWKWGRLESVGTAENKLRYLKFRDGPYWLKAGCDDPENFLGGYEHYNTTRKRKAAIDYLADRGINSCYIMTHNIGGDDNDVWPWLGRTPQEAKRNGGAGARFDIVKLEEWHELFVHMQSRGVVPYLILEDDSAWKGYDHQRYYREIVARFGYLPGLLFNGGEEQNENYRLSEALQLMAELQRLDPYDHPRGLHNVNSPVAEYIDGPQIDFTAIQTGTPGSRAGRKDAAEHNGIAIDWLKVCDQRGRRRLMANFDEGRPEEDRRCWWSAYLGGGVWEAHVLKEYDRPMSAWEKTWNELGGARTFMESLPFWRMEPRNDVVVEGNAFCLAAPGEAYAFYLIAGGSITVELQQGVVYDVAWWNPANNQEGKFSNTTKCAGGRQRLDAPSPGDWAVRVRKRD